MVRTRRAIFWATIAIILATSGQTMEPGPMRLVTAAVMGMALFVVWMQIGPGGDDEQ